MAVSPSSVMRPLGCLLFEEGCCVEAVLGELSVSSGEIVNMDRFSRTGRRELTF